EVVARVVAEHHEGHVDAGVPGTDRVVPGDQRTEELARVRLPVLGLDHHPGSARGQRGGCGARLRPQPDHGLVLVSLPLLTWAVSRHEAPVALPRRPPPPPGQGLAPPLAPLDTAPGQPVSPAPPCSTVRPASRRRSPWRTSCCHPIS